MCISVTEQNRHHAGKIGLIYLLCALFCAVFGAVYEYFSHEVYSYYMLYAFMIPLSAGALPFWILGLYFPEKFPDQLSRCLYHFGLSTLTIGCILEGILEIYGTTNQKIIVYPIVGFGLVVWAVIRFFCKTSK